MHPSLVVFAFPLLSLLVDSVQAVTGTTCNATTLCPAEFPCCSEYGFCGTGNFCLGGCNPLASNTLTSCEPNPVCQNATYTFADSSRILTNSTFFNGNASQYDWTVDKGNIMNTNTSGGELAMLLTEANGGTRLSSTRYVHYGTVTTKLKSGRWGGVVTASIFMSDIHDEIDWEFPGANTTTGQTNFFWQGYIPVNTNNGQVETGLTDTFSNYHEYTVDWQPDTLTFLIDGNVVRTVKKTDTLDPSGVYRYPTTPSRLQLSIWPAGITSEPPGTVQWAGGMINWNDPDYVSAGHFYALVESVTVQCADPGGISPGITGYQYGSNATTETPSVDLTNTSTLLNGAGPQHNSRMQFRGALAVAAGLAFVAYIL